MTYDQEIYQLTEKIKADKNVIQPWRNYALKAANEMQAYIRMGQTTTPQHVQEQHTAPTSQSGSSSFQ